MLIADGGGGSRPTVAHVSTVSTHPKPTTTNDTESDAAARARELQRQIEAMLERLREAQRRAEEARKRAIEAQRKAEQARQAADDARAQAEKTKAAKDEAAAKKAEQESKLADALHQKESADASLKDKEAELLRAQVAQKKEEKKSADGKASPQADRKVDDAQAERDEAQRTSDFSKLYADYQEKETKAQEAEAKVVKLTPAPGRPSCTISDEESSKLSTAQTKATDLRTEADEAKTRFTDTVGTDAGSDFFDSPAPQGSGVPAKTTAAELPDDPLHSPLQQLLQVSPQSTWHAPLLPNTTGTPGWQSSLLAPGTIGTNTTSLTTFNLLPPKQPVVTPEVTRTLDAIADGQSVYQIAEARGVGADKVMGEANAAGITLQSSTLSADAQQTTVKRGDATLTYTLDAHSGTVTVKGSLGGGNSIDASRDGNGRYSQTVQGEKAGETTTRAIDPQAGTRTETVVGADGQRTETTTDLTGATVRRPVERGEGYLDVAEAAGLTPEQLLALNPDVDYGKPLQPGQELVVSGVRTTTKTYNADGTTLEKTVESDGTQHVVATTKDGRRVTLMGEPDKNDGPGEKIRKGLFEDGKSVADMARSLGMGEDQVLAALPSGTVDVASSGGVETRTLHDPESNRVVVEAYDARHGKRSRQVIDEHAVFKVRQYDPETKKYVIAEVNGGVGYLQKQADDKLAYAGDLDKQISDLGATIRLGQRTGEPVSDLLDQRRQLVEQRDTAKGEADIAQAKATSALVKNQQVGLDKVAADAYQQQFVARPGSDEKKNATQALDKTLALVDKVDRLTQATDKDVQYLVADLERNQKHTAKVEADETLQTEFQTWKDEVWRWQGIPETRAKEMKAEGQKPTGTMYRSFEEENGAAWTAFVSRQEFLDEHGDETLTDAERPARDAWLQRNAASTAELESNDEYYEISIEKGVADANVIQGDIDRLQARKDAWVEAHPKDFSETFPGVKGEHGGQKELDLLNDQLAQVEVGGLIDGKDRKFNQYLMGQPVTDREDPEKFEELGRKYGEDNERDLGKVDQQIDDLMTAGIKHKAQVSEAYIEQWTKDNPQLQAKLDQPQTTGSVRAAEARRDELLSSHAGQQLKAALAMKDDARTRLLPVADGDVELVQKDFDRVSKSVESQTWLRDVFSDTAEDSQADTKDQLDQAKALRDDLASGKITLTEYVHQRDELMGTYGAQSIDIAEKLRDSEETWAVVDDAVRMTVSAVAGIGTTILTGGNVAAGIAVGVGVNQLWDSGNDLYAAANGRDMYADGHSSLLTLRIRSMVDPGSITSEQVALTLKDDAVDVANAAVSATGVGAGMRSSAALAARIAARKGIGIGELSFGSRAVVGARSGLVAQGVDGAGRVGVETLHVGLDGKLGTEEGAQRIRATAVSAAVGVLTAPLIGGASGAIPMNKFAVGVGAQIPIDALGSLGTGELIALANDGRHMNQAEFIAASLQTIPGTMTNIALHPSVVSKLAVRTPDEPALPLSNASPAASEPKVLQATRGSNGIWEVQGLGGGQPPATRSAGMTRPDPLETFRSLPGSQEPVALEAFRSSRFGSEGDLDAMYGLTDGFDSYDWSGWKGDVLKHAAAHPQVKAEVLNFIREHTSKATPDEQQQFFDQFFGSNERIVEMAETNSGAQALASLVYRALNRLEHAGERIDIRGWTPLTTPKPDVYQIRPSKPPRLETVEDFVEALRVEPHPDWKPGKEPPRGVTPQSARIAKALERGDIKLHLLSERKFVDKYKDSGGGDTRKAPLAFANNDALYLNVERGDPWALLVDAVHEGTHALDNRTLLDVNRTYEVRVDGQVVERGKHEPLSWVHRGDKEARAFYHQIEFARALGLNSEPHELLGATMPEGTISASDTMAAVHEHIHRAYPNAMSSESRMRLDPFGAPPLDYQLPVDRPFSDHGRVPPEHLRYTSAKTGSDVTVRAEDVNGNGPTLPISDFLADLLANATRRGPARRTEVASGWSPDLPASEQMYLRDQWMQGSGSDAHALSARDPLFSETTQWMLGDHEARPYPTDALHEKRPLMQTYLDWKGSRAEHLGLDKLRFDAKSGASLLRAFVSKQTWKRMAPADRPDFVITRVEILRNPPLLDRFARAHDEVEARTGDANLRLLFSGHSRDTTEAIVNGGHDPLKRGLDSRKGFGALGLGIYLTDTVDKAISYAQEPGQEASILLQGVVLGRTLETTERGPFRFLNNDEMVRSGRHPANQPRPDGLGRSAPAELDLNQFDSLLGERSSDPGAGLPGTWRDRKRFDSDEYLVRNTDQVVPLVRIYFEVMPRS